MKRDIPQSGEHRLEGDSFLAALYDSLPVGVVVVERDGRIATSNPAAREILALVANESQVSILDETNWHTVYPDLSPLPAKERPAAQTFATGKPQRNVILGLPRDDEITWISVNTEPLVASPGEPPYAVVASFIDVTDQRQIEERLRLGEERYKLTTRAGLTGVWDWDLVNDEMYLDPFIKETFGYQDDEIDSSFDAVLEHVHPEDREEFTKVVSEAVAGNASEIRMEFRAIHRDGSVLWLLDHGSVVRDAGGKPLRLLGTVTDITQQRQIEDALQRSQKMDALGQMAGGVAHDVNNVLGIILGNLNLIRHDNPADRQLIERLDRIEKSTQRAADLARKLLGFSRHDTSRRRAVDLNAVVGDMESLIARSITPSIRLELELADDLWAAEVDPDEFQDVMVNLVLNARDAMPTGGILTVQTSNVVIDQVGPTHRPNLSRIEYVRVTVRDTGAGIANGDLPHIFEPFFTTKPKDKGTGLGLALAYGFAKRMGGDITAESTRAGGTAFHLLLPRTTKTAVARERDEKSVSEITGGSESILVVDDEPELVDLVRELLESLGYRVVTAERADAALERLREDPSISLLFSDVVMPGGMDGYHLANEARGLRPGIRILLTSGYTASPSPSEAAVDHSDLEVLQKPYDDMRLARRIRELLDSDIASPGPRSANGDEQSDGMRKEPVRASIMETGIGAIDADHSYLLDMLRRARQISKDVDSVREMSTFLVEIEDHARKHFQREEIAMRACRYPYFDAHRRAHQELVCRIGGMRRQLDSGSLPMNAIIDFLDDWLDNHLRGMDFDCAAYFSNCSKTVRRALDMVE